MKTDLDKSIYAISIASIKRHTMKPYDFEFTKIYNLNTELSDLFNITSLEDGERAICHTIIESDLWTLLTTRRIVTRDKEELYEVRLQNIKNRRSGNFKGIGGIPYERGNIECSEKGITPFFLETRKASMVMIYGIMTSSEMLLRGDDWIFKTERRYKKRGFFELE